MTQTVIPNVSANEKNDYIQNQAIRALNRAVSAMREPLTASRNYYVRSDGSDTNNGMGNTAAGAFKTIAHAVAVAESDPDKRDHDVIVNIASGTFTENLALKAGIPDEAFQGALRLKGAGIASTTIDGHIYVTGHSWDIDQLKLTNTAADGRALIEADGGAFVTVGAIDFSTNTGGNHLFSHNMSTIWQYNDYTISGNASRHWSINGAGFIRCRSVTVTISNTPAFSSSFVNISDSGTAEVDGNTFSGSATGKRFVIAGGGKVFTNTSSLTYLPGDTAGTNDGGFYNNQLGADNAIIAAGVTTNLAFSQNTPTLQVNGTSGSSSSMGAARYSADNSPVRIELYKSRATAIGSTTAVSSGDRIAEIVFELDGGTGPKNAARIVGVVASAVGSTSSPGRVEIETVPSGSTTFTSRGVLADQSGNFIWNTNSVATTATDGFIYTPTCSGTPTGTPTAYAGRVPMLYDTSTNKFYIYNGAWKAVTLA